MIPAFENVCDDFVANGHHIRFEKRRLNMSQRLDRVLGHADGGSGLRVRTEGRCQLHKELQWNGWGFDDTRFTVNAQGIVRLEGTRYLYSGAELPALRGWMEETIGASMDRPAPEPQASMSVSSPIHADTSKFIDSLAGVSMEVSLSIPDRIDHAHGHSAHEIYELRYGSFHRIPDIVVWPENEASIVQLIQTVERIGGVIIPYGGGTSVTHGVMPMDEEIRLIISVDMRKMCRVLSVDLESMQVCVQAGASGSGIEAQLRERGLCLGHEPDSSEFSTLGGWISTRASGMKKNKYGNIEDILLQVRLVTCNGIIQKQTLGPRVSMGPDVNEFILGSEGVFGIITSAVLKVCRLPQVQKYGSLVFPDFESGVACLHEIAMKKLQPASMRLVDNTQFAFGQALKPASEHWKDDIGDLVKKYVLTNWLKYDPKQLVVATLVLEGSKNEVESNMSSIKKIARKYYGLSGGEENGRRGFFLTYVIAYLRDIAFDYRVLCESFETSMPWKDVLRLCENVKLRITESCKNKGFVTAPFTSCRVTQVYDTGACVYFYFGVVWDGVEEPMHAFAEVENEARDEVIACGGSLSHHHGVGKLRKKWMAEQVSAPGLDMIKALKHSVDPNNVFASGNLF